MNADLPATAATEADIDAPVEQVWQALTSPDGLAPWLGDDAMIEATPGGGLHVSDPVTGTPRRGEVRRVEEGRRLEFTWWPVAAPADRSDVSIIVEAVGDRTRVLVVESVPGGAITASITARAAWAWRLASWSVLGVRVG